MSADGDSGAPLFVGEAIAGVHAFNAWLQAADVNEAFDSSWGEVSFNTRVSSFQDFIVTSTGGEAVFVPEPSSKMLFALAIMAYCFCTTQSKVLHSSSTSAATPLKLCGAVLLGKPHDNPLENETGFRWNGMGRFQCQVGIQQPTIDFPRANTSDLF